MGVQRRLARGPELLGGEGLGQLGVLFGPLLVGWIEGAFERPPAHVPGKGFALFGGRNPALLLYGFEETNG